MNDFSFFSYISPARANETIEGIKTNALNQDDACQNLENLDEAQLEKLADAFKTNTTFTLLDLHLWAGEKLTKRILKLFLDALEQNPNAQIHQIDLPANEDILIEFSEFIKASKYKKLTFFVASWGNITDKGGIAIGEALATTKLQLNGFNLTKNQMGDAGIEKIAQALCSNPNNNKIDTAYLDNNPNMTDKSIEALKMVITHRQENTDSNHIEFGIGENIGEVSLEKAKELKNLEEALKKSKQPAQGPSG